MQIVHLTLDDEYRISEPLAACIGYFDGLHLGHQELIKKTINNALNNRVASALITFYPDPDDVIKKTKNKHIFDFDSRIKIMKNLGLDYCIVFHFDEELMEKTPQTFLMNLLSKVYLKSLVCGFDFTYGHQGKGNISTLKADSDGLFSLDVVNEIDYLGSKISSSRIIEALMTGDLELVNCLLGFDYFIKGKVIHGLGNGHRLGFPTANIAFNNDIVLPKAQVYAGYCKVNGQYYKAMTNLGYNPSVLNDLCLSLETHIIDFDGDLYDQEIYVFFKRAIRDEKRFNSLDDLIKQLNKDAEFVKKSDNDGNFIL